MRERERDISCDNSCGHHQPCRHQLEFSRGRQCVLYDPSHTLHGDLRTPVVYARFNAVANTYTWSAFHCQTACGTVHISLLSLLENNIRQMGQINFVKSLSANVDVFPLVKLQEPKPLGHKKPAQLNSYVAFDIFAQNITCLEIQQKCNFPSIGDFCLVNLSP